MTASPDEKRAALELAIIAMAEYHHSEFSDRIDGFSVNVIISAPSELQTKLLKSIAILEQMKAEVKDG